MSKSATGRSLRSVLEEAKAPYEELTMRLLFCTTICAGDSRYRIREIEIYSEDDPYTHRGDEQVSTTGGWYFHRTKPGGGWKGGTFMGLDISFAPVGTAGGVLIRGISRIAGGKDKYEYFDGPCNCVKEFLRACGVSKIKDLVDKPTFKLDALASDAIFRLVEHAPEGVLGPPGKGLNPAGQMEWKAASRVGLSEPAKFPEKAKARKKFHLAPLRFLQAPYETKKEKTNIKTATVGGVFTTEQFQKLGAKATTKQNENTDGDSGVGNFGHDDDSDSDVKPFGGKTKKKKTNNPDLFADTDDSDMDTNSTAENKKMKELFGDSDDDSDDDSDHDEPANNTHQWKPKTHFETSKCVNNEGAPVWHYWLDIGMDGKKRGWHSYEKSAYVKLEGFLQNKGEQLSRTTWHLKSGYFSYEVDISNMTQRNMKSGTVRPIRRVLPGEVCSMSEPPVYVPPKNPTASPVVSSSSAKKHKAPPTPPTSSSQKPKKKAKTEEKSGLNLEPLFGGKYGHAWEKMLTDVVESLPQAENFMGPDRSKEILPIREMTFRALMALPPEENNLIVFGQAPYPRVESASGIAMFDTLIKDWECAQFGKTVSMRCIAKTAAVAKGIVNQDATVKDLRKLFKEQNIVSPPEWFQAMLAQGVLMLNASLTIGSFSTAQHTNFWKPVMKAIVEEILRSKRDKFSAGSPKRRIGFLWWGNEALKTKKALASVLAKYDKDVEITHIEHFNPAAQGDKFSEPPNHFEAVNAALVKGNLEPINWLPDKDWLEKNHVDEHAAFITDTQELHKLYLDRLQSGLDTTNLSPIVGIMESDLLTLPDACDALGLKTTATSALSTVQKFNVKTLSSDEKGAVYLYTTNVLYRRLNEALRNPNRSKVNVYFNYLRVFLEAYSKMKAKPQVLYRGINKDLSTQYSKGAKVTWWTISSCTPNINVAKAFGGGLATGTLFYVTTKTAVPIMHLSAYKSEEEYVLAPGTVLKVERVVKEPNKATEIYLEEIEGKRWVQ